MRNKGKGFTKGRRQKGITLVALVVTVVVLLILAGVSIRLVLDNNGIITKAGDAKDKTYIEAIKEAKEMWDAEKYLDATSDSLADYLYNHKVITEEEKDIVSSGGTITKGNYSVSFEPTAKTLVEAFNAGELKVGDWVNYTNPTTVSADVKATDSNYSDTGYTSPASKTGLSTADGYSEDIDQEYSLTNNGVQLNWRVLGLSEDGNHLLITIGSPLQRTWDSSKSSSASNSRYFWLYGAKGASTEYGIKELNKICAMYKNNLATEARSLTIDDINRLCEVTVDVANKKVTTTSDTATNIDKWGNIGLTYSYPTSSYPTQYESPEDYIAGNKVTTLNSFSKTSDAYYYEGSDAIDSTSALYDILFNNTSSKYYWLASRAVGVFSGECFWGPGRVRSGGARSFRDGMFYSYGDGIGYGGAVRPVVYLKSDVTVDDIQKIDTPTSGEEAWS